MSYQEQFLPGMENGSVSVSNLDQSNSHESEHKPDLNFKAEFIHHERPGYVEGCAQCEIEGALGCSRHRKLK